MQLSERYKRHRPETTLLYQLVELYYLDFTANLVEQGRYLPKYVEREFGDFLRCGRLEHGFLRVVCGDCKHEEIIRLPPHLRCGVIYLLPHKKYYERVLMMKNTMVGVDLAKGPRLIAIKVTLSRDGLVQQTVNKHLLLRRLK